MANPFFSIVIPTYNRALFIGDAIESVIKQTFLDWELIIIDDGSADNTKSVVSSFLLKDSRIKYIYQENQERSIARNNGINQANGEFICFLDSDDQFLPNHLFDFKKTISNTQNKLSIFYSNIVLVENGVTKKTPIITRNPDQNLQTFLFHSSIGTVRLCIHKSILEINQFDPNIRISEDTDLLIRIACSHPYLINTGEYGILINIHDENSINYKFFNAYKERKETLKKILNKKSVYGIEPRVARKTINDCNMGVFKYYICQKKYFKAWLTILNSFIEYPSYKTKEKMYLIFVTLWKRKFDF